jgi:tetratricopeptide (TPR) repeat protein
MCALLITFSIVNNVNAYVKHQKKSTIETQPISVDNGDFESFIDAIETLIEQKKYQEALKKIKQGLKRTAIIAPKNAKNNESFNGKHDWPHAELWKLLGELHLLQHQHQQAQAALEYAAKLHENFTEAHQHLNKYGIILNLLANTYASQNNPKAAPAFEQALKQFETELTQESSGSCEYLGYHTALTDAGAYYTKHQELEKALNTYLRPYHLSFNAQSFGKNCLLALITSQDANSTEDALTQHIYQLTKTLGGQKAVDKQIKWFINYYDTQFLSYFETSRHRTLTQEINQHFLQLCTTAKDTACIQLFKHRLSQ